MTGERKQKLLQIYRIALSCVIVLAGICLMVACISIYRSGDEPFSREAVAAAFAPISIPVYLCLAMVLGGFLLKLAFPAPAKKTAAWKQPTVTLKRLQSRADLESCDQSLKTEILAQQQRRKNQKRICTLVLAACALVFLVYALDGSHFHTSEINISMIRAMWVLLPCAAVSFGVCIWFVHVRKNSMLQEIDLLKQCPKKDAPQAATKSGSCTKVRYALLLAAAALALFGFFSGGTADVLTKAVNICTECIGLG